MVEGDAMCALYYGMSALLSGTMYPCISDYSHPHCGQEVKLVKPRIKVDILMSRLKIQRNISKERDGVKDNTIVRK
jgi:hypothetical protein